MSYPKPRRLKTPDHRFGEGKVHILVYSRENKVWYTLCQSGTYGKPQGREVDPTTEPTCKKCLGDRP